MPTTNLSSPIAIVVDRAHRQAVSSSDASTNKGGAREGFGEGFVRNFFVSTDALAEALRPELLGLLNDAAVEPLLQEDLKSQIRTHFLSKAHEIALLVVARLCERHQTSLQAATLAFLKSRPGTSFCFQAPSNPTAQITRPNRPVLSLRTRYPGRDNEVKGIVEVLLDTTRTTPSVVLGGVGGIGKTTLALIVLNEGAVRAWYGGRRFWINCESTYSAEAFLETVVAALSSTSTLSALFALPLDHVDQDFLGLLDRIGDDGEPALVTFDNLETVYDTEPKLVERVLAVLLTRCAVLVTMRGQRRPYIGGPWSWPRSKDSRIERLPKIAWRPAFEAHAGFELSANDYATIEPVLQQLDGYPLALSLLGLRLARGEITVHNLRRAWGAEIARDEAPDDTRETNIVTSVRLSLSSLVNTPFAIDTLVLTASLPPGFYRPREGDHIAIANGLPEWLGRALCASEEAQSLAWTKICQCGLAYVDADALDRLQLLPPIQEALRWREPITYLSPASQEALLGALDRVYKHDRTVIGAFSEADNGDFGEAALKNLRHGGTLVPAHLRSREERASDIVARSTHLLATMCRHAGFLASAKLLFHEADLEYTALGTTRDAVCMRASKIRLERRLASEEGRLQDAMSLAEEEAALWDLASSPQDAAWARAKELSFHAEIAEHDDQLEHAAGLHADEAQLWEQAELPMDAAWARAQRCDLRARMAGREDRFDDGVRFREEEARLWMLAGRTQWAAAARAEALDLCTEIAERDGRLEDGARLREEEALLWEEAGTSQSSAWAHAQACSLRARVAMSSHRLEDAARFHEQEASLWESAEQPQDAAAAKAEACNVRAQMAELDNQLQAACEHRIAEAEWWDQSDVQGNADEARRKVDELRRQITEPGGHLERSTKPPTERTSLLESPQQRERETPEQVLASSGDGEDGDDGHASSTLWVLCCGCRLRA